MMVNLMRANQRWLMIVVCVLVLISFLWFFSNNTRIQRLGGERAGTIYGRSVSVAEMQRAQRQVVVAGELGLAHVYAPELTQQVSLEDALVDQFVLQHQADALGIFPTAEEADEAAQKLPAFRGSNGAFDPNVKDDFVAQKLSPRGFTEGQVIELVKRDLQFAKLRELLDSTVFVTPVEVRTTYEEYFTKAETSVIRFKTADFPTAEPSEDDVKKAFEAQKDEYKQPERRKVQYVRFGMDDAQKKLTGKERVEALTALRDQAVAFLVKLNDARGKEDFAAVAKAANAPVKDTPEFEEQNTVGLPEAGVAGFTAAAFNLTQQEPDSSVPLTAPLRAPEAFYIMHLSGVTPARPLTLEEARPKIVASLKAEREKEALSAKAEEVRTAIADALKAGKSFPEAAKAAGQTPQDLPGFAVAEPPPADAAPDFSDLAGASTEIATGELSKFLPSSTGGALLYVRTRTGVDEAAYEKAKDGIAIRLRTQKRRAAFEEWLRTAREDAGARMTGLRRS